jgi:chorismate mutase
LCISMRIFMIEKVNYLFFYTYGDWAGPRGSVTRYWRGPVSPDNTCAERADRQAPSGLGISRQSDTPLASEIEARLASIRASIDNIDSALVFLLAERFKATQQVGLLKAIHHLPPADLSREAQQIARLRSKAEEANLDPVFAEKFLNFIIREVIQHHKAISEHHNGGAELPTAGPEAR